MRRGDIAVPPSGRTKDASSDSVSVLRQVGLLD
jgi:hypothetical protein